MWTQRVFKEVDLLQDSLRKANCRMSAAQICWDMHNRSCCQIWVFPKIGVSPKWMVYSGNPIKNGWFGGTTIFGNSHICHRVLSVSPHLCFFHNCADFEEYFCWCCDDKKLRTASYTGAVGWKYYPPLVGTCQWLRWAAYSCDWDFKPPSSHFPQI